MRIRSVAAAVVLTFAVTACGGGGDAGDGGDGGAQGGGADGALQVVAGDLYFEPEELTAPAGEVTVELVNEGAVVHNFVVEEAGDTNVAEAQGGETATGTIELEAGTYTFYCDVPGHRAAMEGTLTVE